MIKYLFTFLLLFISFFSFSQYEANLGGSIGSGASMFSVGIEREYDIVSKKIHINPGIRFNGFSGKDLDYITAPAEYTVNDDQVDTLGFSNSGVSFANLYVRLGYDFSDKWSVSFDIDVAGITFGSEQKGNKFRPGEALGTDPLALPVAEADASPTLVNLLLVGDNDRGSLNSTLGVTYNVTKRLGISAGAGLVFTEYTTDGTIGYDGNDRFRNKNMMGYLGVSYRLGDK